MTDTQDVAGVARELPRINLGVKLEEGQKVLCEVVADQWEPGKYGEQLHIALRPLAYELRGQTGTYHEWYGVSTNKRSKMGALIEALKFTFGTNNPETNAPYNLGYGEFKGKICWWIRKEMSFGRDKDSGSQIKSEVWIPAGKASREDVEKAEQDRATSGATNDVNGQTSGTINPDAVVQTRSLDLSADDIEAVITHYQGKTAKEATRTVIRSTLSQEAKNAVMSGGALDYLLAQGLVTLGTDDKVQVVTPEAVQDQMFLSSEEAVPA